MEGDPGVYCFYSRVCTGLILYWFCLGSINSCMLVNNKFLSFSEDSFMSCPLQSLSFIIIPVLIIAEYLESWLNILSVVQHSTCILCIILKSGGFSTNHSYSTITSFHQWSFSLTSRISQDRSFIEVYIQCYDTVLHSQKLRILTIVLVTQYSLTMHWKNI